MADKIIDNLYRSNVAKRLARVVELQKEAHKAKLSDKVAKAERLVDRLVQRKVAQVEVALAAGATNYERLADYILHHELYDNTPYKIANTEYPIMSERMFDERRSKDTGEGAIDKEQDRISRGSRRQRTRYESAFMDRTVKAKNKERRKIYREFTKVQPVYTYYVD